jgi:uncharacterized membrane protein YhaH (DUF805 family)
MRIREYFSLSGSFSRAELWVAAFGLFALAVLIVALAQACPDPVSRGGYTNLIFFLYPIWGAALGKRSRDLGSTFSYGMIIGMFIPVIGLLFLFQAGEKYRKSKAKRPVHG